MKEEATVAIIDKELEETELEIAKWAEIWKSDRKEEKDSWYKKIFG